MKRSDIHHVTFHIGRTAVLLSVPESTTLASLRAQLVPALATIADLPSQPSSASDVQLWEDREVDGAEPGGIRVCAEGSIKSLEWPRWKRVYVSVRDDSGEFTEPKYTVPDPTDGDEE